MIYTVLKIFVSAIMIAAISEIAKKSTFLAALLTSLPLVALSAMVWMYLENQDIKAISSLSVDIFWLVIPSLVLFATLPYLLNRKVPFYSALLVSVALTISCYLLMILIMRKLGR